MMRYKTKLGDMWDKIAYEQMGSTEYTDILMNSNAAYSNVYIFSSDIELTIPEVAEPIVGGAPPWKRGAGELTVRQVNS
ncbi:MAG: phage tail protein [Oscillospiraceae bacterium]|jgi:phage tail protein X|nr:phage tail protein [Oscillospiraceae bacterium]